MRFLPNLLEVVTLDIEARIVAAKDASKNTLVLALGKAHCAKLSHAFVKSDEGASELLKNGLRVGRSTGNIVATVVWIDDTELCGTVRPVELSIGRSLSKYVS